MLKWLIRETVDTNTTYWWGTSANLRVVPRSAVADSTPIATQAIGERLSALKEVIHTIAVQWVQIEALNLPKWKLHRLPVIGSDDWDAM